jgi:hypothetical protein
VPGRAAGKTERSTGCSSSLVDRQPLASAGGTRVFSVGQRRISSGRWFDECDDQEESRERLCELCDARQYCVGPLSSGSRQTAQHQTNHHGKGGGRESNGERYGCAVNHTREHVASRSSVHVRWARRDECCVGDGKWISINEGSHAPAIPRNKSTAAPTTPAFDRRLERPANVMPG